MSARRSISASGCAALNDSRSRAVPSGTVGGRIATDEEAFGFEKLRGGERRRSLADHDRHDGALRCRQARGAGKSLRLGERQRQPVRLALDQVEAAMAAATIGGGRPVE